MTSVNRKPSKKVAYSPEELLTEDVDVVVVPPGAGYPQPEGPPPPYSRVASPPRLVRSPDQPLRAFQRYLGKPAPLGPLGPHPARIICPMCGADIVTGVVPRPGLMAYIACTAMFCIGCVWGCCLIPFCLEPFQDVDHICPNCQRIVYRYRAF